MTLESFAMKLISLAYRSYLTEYLTTQAATVFTLINMVITTAQELIRVRLRLTGHGTALIMIQRTAMTAGGE